MRVVLAFVIAGSVSCAQRVERTLTTAPPTTFDHKPAYLKVHMRDGDLYVLDHWAVGDGTLTGSGALFGVDRELIAKGPQRIAMTDVALYESNTLVTSPWMAPITLLAGVTAGVGVYCATNPKACFGSCPTFYAPGETGAPVLQAEGFSDAIAPSLEHHDIDALWRTRSTGGQLTVTMTNEAYETHVVRRADLLIAPRPPGGRVLSTGEELWAARSLAAPTECTASEGDCLEAVRALDSRERTSRADETDLAARETIELTFPPVSGRAGIAIAARQSLVTTFLLYQGLAYLGHNAGSWLASLERGDQRAHDAGRMLQRLVGAIDVEVERDGTWVRAGEVFETGPLATDVHLVVLPDGANGAHVRLRLPKGGWRLDYIALAALDQPVTPVRLAPSKIRGALGTEFAAGRTPASAFPIVTLPGDRYELQYMIPPGEDWELFLDSRGYYLEWMRSEWLAEQNPLGALAILLDPADALRSLAPAFKQSEADAERVFWRSRYAHP